MVSHHFEVFTGDSDFINMLSFQRISLDSGGPAGAGKTASRTLVGDALAMKNQGKKQYS